jgi:hypothetical protein
MQVPFQPVFPFVLRHLHKAGQAAQASWTDSAKKTDAGLDLSKGKQ